MIVGDSLESLRYAAVSVTCWVMLICCQVDSDDAPARKRRKLSTLIETPKVPSVAEHLTYSSQNEPRPCNSHQAATLPPRQSTSLAQCQSASLPPSAQPRSSADSARTSQHSLRTRRRYDAVTTSAAAAAAISSCLTSVLYRSSS